MIQKLQPLLLLTFLVSNMLLAENQEKQEEQKEQETTQGISEINASQRKSLGIVTENVELHNLSDEISLPGEIIFNAYKTSFITTRISAQVVKRLVHMGDMVKNGQKLATLTSVEMANAQGQLLIMHREWQRIQKLGRDIVAEQRYIKAQVNFQQGIAKLLAYGMTKTQIDALLTQKNAAEATGEFDLLSQQEGTIIHDQFLTGQIVEPGQRLMEISDETSLWVEAKINPNLQQQVKLGNQVRISSGKKEDITGKIVQIHRRVDETTRTLPIRIEIENHQGLYYPGQFVQVILKLESSTEVIAVPSSSIILLQGEQVVFVIEGNKISPRLIETGTSKGDWVEIIQGLSNKDKIVTQGTFALKSTLLKSQIGDSD